MPWKNQAEASAKYQQIEKKKDENKGDQDKAVTNPNMNDKEKNVLILR